MKIKVGGQCIGSKGLMRNSFQGASDIYNLVIRTFVLGFNMYKDHMLKNHETLHKIKRGDWFST